MHHTGARGVNSDPFAVECKEYVRAKLIGKTVSVSVEYQRGGESGKDIRQFGTVTYASNGGGGNGTKRGGIGARVDMALLLVQEGLAVTVRHRGDEPR